MLRKLAIFIALGFLAGVSFVLGFFYAVIDRPPAAHVQLTDRLPNDVRQANNSFDARVRSSFPVSSSFAEMAAKLKQQGFVRGDWGGLQDEHYAFRREDVFACNIKAVVTWRQDQSERITQIAGRYGEGGCL